MGDLTLPIMSIDAFHFKTNSFTGRLVNLCSKDPYGKAVLLSFAIVPEENVRHLGWTIECNVLHGISFQILPLFSDQGALLATARALTQGHHKNHLSYRRYIVLNIHICVIHYIRSTYGPFKEFLKNFEKIIHKAILSMSNSTSMDEFFGFFFSHLKQIVVQLPPGPNFGKAVGSACSYGVFLLRVHPKHWTVFANCPSFDSNLYDYQRRQVVYTTTFLANVSNSIDQLVSQFPNKKVDLETVNDEKNKHLTEKYLQEAYTQTKNLISKRKLGTYKDIQGFSDQHNRSRFFTSNTNTSEGFANGSSWTGGRDDIPPVAMYNVLNQQNTKLEQLESRMKKQIVDKQLLTGIGQNVIGYIRNFHERIKVVTSVINSITSATFTVAPVKDHYQENWNVTLTMNNNESFGPLIATHCQQHEHITSQIQCLCPCVTQIIESAESEKHDLPPFLKNFISTSKTNVIHSFLPKCFKVSQDKLKKLGASKVFTKKSREHPYIPMQVLDLDGKPVTNKTFSDCHGPPFDKICYNVVPRLESFGEMHSPLPKRRRTSAKKKKSKPTTALSSVVAP